MIKIKKNEAVNYLKEAIYGNPTDVYYFELAELLFDLKEYTESMYAYNISAQYGYKDKHFAYYNAACAASMAMNKDKGFSYLKKALDAGYNYWNHMNKDADIKYLRADKQYEEIINLYK